ncbi:MAG TPA: DUF6279 family lipoprotein [Nitrosomonas sp.]|nr:DUF6279 family lipoprotein [Nitrosomonas sp.]HRB32056.1 DUF6279 family lipoprotein [Nitrosomonas sp.]HRB45494.1 DUF6279 family lipoprotein [Nitrosomonas sp.]HRB76990.1 DUF6279 family lipoprotein [Nitrosomonas sp.]
MLSSYRIAVFITLLLLLNGCSMMRLGYDNGPHLAWWWIDSYLDFDKEQTPHVKQAIQDWFSWHRAHQLPEYATWLASVHHKLEGTLTSTQVCNESEHLKKILAPAFDHAVQLSAPIVLKLSDIQLQHLEQRYTKSNEELRSDFLQTDLNERKQASVKRTVKRIENLYGDLDKKQHLFIITSIENSPFKPEAWMTERVRQQQAVLQALRKFTTEPATTEQVTSTLKTLIENIQRSENADYRAYQLELSAYTCDFIAKMHNITTTTQRQHVQKKIKTWETDIHALMLKNHSKTALQ